jgi:UDP-N-acetylmuramoylalanine--D-glutamate ligase
MTTFSGKKVAVLGLSTEGIDTATFMVAEGARVHCHDRRTAKELGPNYILLQKFPVTFHLGKDYLQNLNLYDLLVRTPGMALNLPELKEVRSKLTSSTKLFFDLCPAKIIGVTGTKGKGTTTTLIGEILKTAGKAVFVGGNVGVPLLSRVWQIKTHDWVVLELSSFQLEDLHKSPHISVILNISSDHLANADPLATNYHVSRSAYVEAKKNIVKYQKSSDFAVINRDYHVSAQFAKETKSRVIYFSTRYLVPGVYIKNNSIYVSVNGNTQEVGSVQNLLLRGKHNWENVAAAIAAAILAGADLDAVKKAIYEFKGLEHRLELVGTYGGATYYNDSFSTTPETAIAAIRAFSEPVILIAGGSEKGSDFTDLGRVIVDSSVKAVILIGDMADRIEASITKAGGRQPKLIKGLTSMSDVITAARKEVADGDVVLLSPACASFGMFKNYKERGKLFKHYAAKAS